MRYVLRLDNAIATITSKKINANIRRNMLKGPVVPGVDPSDSIWKKIKADIIPNTATKTIANNAERLR